MIAALLALVILFLALEVARLRSVVRSTKADADLRKSLLIEALRGSYLRRGRR